MKLVRSRWHGGRAELDSAPAGLLYKRFRYLWYWFRPAHSQFIDLWAVRITSNCGRVSAFAHKVVGYHGCFEFDWLQSDHVSKILVTHTRGNSLLTVGECEEGTYSWVFCSATTDARALNHDDVTFVANLIASRQGCQDLTGVYFISNGRGAVKIGLSNRRMHDRLKALQMHNPDHLRIVAVIPDASPDALEHKLHSEFSGVRIRNEWFRMTDDEARKAAVENGGFPIDSPCVDTK